MIEPHSDIRYEILDANSHGMFLCQQQSLDDAEHTLNDAYTRLQDDDSIGDAQFVDQLKAATLNNLGVVECHKGLHRQALTHLESALALEVRWEVTSPSTLLNLCATHNALGDYASATQYALRTIQALHEHADDLTEEYKVTWGAAWHNLGIAQLNTATPRNPTEFTNVLVIFRNAMKATQDLLGMRHPMTVAVHETFRSVREQLKVRGAFTQHDSLMTSDGLPAGSSAQTGSGEGGVGGAGGGGEGGGVSSAAPAVATLLPPATSKRELAITIRGRDSKERIVEKAPSSAYAGSTGGLSANTRPGTRGDMGTRGTARTSLSSRGGGGGGGAPAVGRPLRGIPLSGTLLEAGSLYTNPHPLLKHGRPEGTAYTPHRSFKQEHIQYYAAGDDSQRQLSSRSGAGAGAGGVPKLPRIPSGPTSNNSSARVPNSARRPGAAGESGRVRRAGGRRHTGGAHTARGGGADYVAVPDPGYNDFDMLSGGGGGSRGGGAHARKQNAAYQPRRVSDLLMGDMWVDAQQQHQQQQNRSSTSPSPARGGGSQQGGSPTTGAGGGAGQQRTIVRPTYAQALYSLDLLSNSKVVEPMEHAQLDHQDKPREKDNEASESQQQQQVANVEDTDTVRLSMTAGSGTAAADQQQQQAKQPVPPAAGEVPRYQRGGANLLNDTTSSSSTAVAAGERPLSGNASSLKALTAVLHADDATSASNTKASAPATAGSTSEDNHQQRYPALEALGDAFAARQRERDEKLKKAE